MAKGQSDERPLKLHSIFDAYNLIVQYNHPKEMILPLLAYLTIRARVSPNCCAVDENGEYVALGNTRIRPPKASDVLIDLSDAELT